MPVVLSGRILEFQLPVLHEGTASVHELLALVNEAVLVHLLES